MLLPQMEFDGFKIAWCATFKYKKSKYYGSFKIIYFILFLFLMSQLRNVDFICSVKRRKYFLLSKINNLTLYGQFKFTLLY